MIRTCDGTDPNLRERHGAVGSCGRTFDDVDHWTFCPHDYFPPGPGVAARAGARMLHEARPDGTTLAVAPVGAKVAYVMLECLACSQVKQQKMVVTDSSWEHHRDSDMHIQNVKRIGGAR